ncbi:MAG: transglycosylase domain-containing protein [Pyrinomonadaceae bacterium]
MKFVLSGSLILFTLWVLYEVVTFPNISQLRSTNPQTTSLIETRTEEAGAAGEQGHAFKKIQIWVQLADISINLQRAVLAGEDANFTTHHGFDYDAIRKAWEQGQREAEKESRKEGDSDPLDFIPSLSNFRAGASTITQQLAKNLYLSSERSWTRKAREAVITYFLERKLTKKRILELYLNVIEWGDGIYGAEAASEYYFKKPAANLTASEAAFLVAIIPNPRTVFNPALHSKRVARRQSAILRGMASVKLTNLL